MNSAGLLLVLFLLGSSNVLAVDCRKNIIAHSDMVTCARNHLVENESLIEKLIREKGGSYEISEGYYDSQRKSIHDRCMIYSGLGGQRSEILEVQCEVDETKRLFDLIESYIRDSDAD